MYVKFFVVLECTNNFFVRFISQEHLSIQGC